MAIEERGPRSFKGQDDIMYFQKMGGTNTRTKAKWPVFKYFPVPLSAWDKVGTTAGQGTVFSVRQRSVSGCHTSPRHTTGTLVHRNRGQWSRMLQVSRVRFQVSGFKLPSLRRRGGIPMFFIGMTGWFSESRVNGNVELGSDRERTTPSGKKRRPPLLRKEGSFGSSESVW